MHEVTFASEKFSTKKSISGAKKLRFETLE